VETAKISVFVSFLLVLLEKVEREEEEEEEEEEWGIGSLRESSFDKAPLCSDWGDCVGKTRTTAAELISDTAALPLLPLPLLPFPVFFCLPFCVDDTAIVAGSFVPPSNPSSSMTVTSLSFWVWSNSSDEPDLTISAHIFVTLTHFPGFSGGSF
jgi:hypothetical protein